MLTFLLPHRPIPIFPSSDARGGQCQRPLVGRSLTSALSKEVERGEGGGVGGRGYDIKGRKARGKGMRVSQS